MARLAGHAGLAPGLANTALTAQLRAMSPQPQLSLSAGPVQLGLTDTLPEVFDTGEIALVLDGWIYNPEILPPDSTLSARIAALIEQRGFVAALESLNGDFSLAVYDRRDNTLWLGRDRLGIKPLYYTSLADGGFAFASQPAGLIVLPGVSRQSDSRFTAVYAGSHYRYFDNEPEDSPFADLRQLPAAHWLSWRDGKLQTGRYWSLDDAPDWPGTEQELAEQYRELLLDAVMRRFRQANQPAFTLSGGMDSSSVLASAVAGSGERQQAFSSVYADKTYDEREDIETILAQTVSQWHPIAVEPDDVFATIGRMVAVNNEPVATATWLSHYLICGQVASQGFSSLFGGLGGDELNAGEYEYFFNFFGDLVAAGEQERYQQEVKGWALHHDHPIYRKNLQVADEGLRRMLDLNQPGVCLPERVRLERYADVLDPQFFDLRAYQPNMVHPFKSYLKNRTWQDLFYETTQCCLRAQDRHGEHFGLAHLNPFLDYRLLEFMFRVPGSLKIRDGVTKILLREAMVGTLPESTRSRVKKTGWNAPAHLWFAGQNQARLLDMVSSQRFRQRGIYNLSRVEALIREHAVLVSSPEPRENHMMFLWQLVNLELWFQWLESDALNPVTT